jgi:hypothetical protein
MYGSRAINIGPGATSCFQVRLTLNPGPRCRAAAGEPTARAAPRWTVAARASPNTQRPRRLDTACRRHGGPAAVCPSRPQRRLSRARESAARDDQPRLPTPPATSATAAARARASAPGRRPAQAGAPISWLLGRQRRTGSEGIGHVHPGGIWALSQVGGRRRGDPWSTAGLAQCPERGGFQLTIRSALMLAIGHTDVPMDLRESARGAVCDPAALADRQPRRSMAFELVWGASF